MPKSPQSLERSVSPEIRAERARAVFAAHCVECHGPDLKFPKSDFGYVTDLARLATSDLIVPGAPDASRLWQLLAAGDMPPEEATSPPPTAADKEAVRAWIEGLKAETTSERSKTEAPSQRAEPALSPDDVTDDPRPASSRDFAHRLWTLLGHAHIIAVHFPIALLVAAAGLELPALARAPPSSPATRTLVRIGALSAIAAAAMGWLLAWNRPDIPGSDLWVHRWLGTGAALAAALILTTMERTARTGLVPAWVRAGLVAVGVSIAIAAHFGGVLVHGAHWMRF